MSRRKLRDRYIAFIVHPPIDRRRLDAALRGAPVSDRLRLVDFDGSWGLVRCAHVEKDATVAFLNALTVKGAQVRTIGTSGTIRKATEKFRPASPTK